MKKDIKNITGKEIINYIIRFFVLGLAGAAAYAILRDIVFLIEFGTFTRVGFSFTGLLKVITELIITGALVKFGGAYAKKSIDKNEIEG